MRFFLLLILLASQTVRADYYSISDSDLHEDKIITLSNGQEITVKNGSVAFKNNDNFVDLIDTNQANMYGVKEVVLAKEEQPKKLKIYNFVYLLRNTVNDDLFILRTGTKDLVVKSSSTKKRISTRFYPQGIDVTKYKYKAIYALNELNVLGKSGLDYVLSKHTDKSGNIFSLEVLGGGKLTINKVVNNALNTFLLEKAKRVITVEAFNFTKEKIYLSYLSQNKSIQQRMKVTYSMEGKNIKSVVKVPISMLDPEKDTNQVVKHIGFFRDLPSRDLFEMQKVELIGGQIELKWLNNPKEKAVLVENKGQKELIYKTKRQRFYAFEGLLYLISWMQKNAVEEKIITYMNGAMPFDATLRKTGVDRYVMEKSGNTLYKFNTNALGIVSNIQYPAYELNIGLETVSNDTTRENVDFLTKYQFQNNIIMVKE